MKTVFAMVGTHSAFTKAAKSHLTGCQVDDGVIDTSASESTVGSNFDNRQGRFSKRFIVICSACFSGGKEAQDLQI